MFSQDPKFDLKISSQFLVEKDWEGQEGFISVEDSSAAVARFKFKRLLFFR